MHLRSARWMNIALMIAAVCPLALLAAAQSKARLPKAAESKAITQKTPLPKPLLPKPLPRLEFLRDIAPLLDRNGCSAAACHGKFGGRGGFQLSLLTLSPEDDYAPIVYGDRGRRINFAAPEKSLLLLKPTGQVPHEGGLRFPVGSPAYNTLLRWIREGAPFTDQDPRLVSLAMKPSRVALSKVGQKQPLRVVATYTDGSTRDVTGQCVYQSTDDALFRVTQDGGVTGLRWGGGAILCRYLGTIGASFFTLPQTRKGPYPNAPANNVIDRLVFDNLRRLNVVPSDLCSDSAFLRRVTLDTLGRLPNVEETRAFLVDTLSDKRARCIDGLLERPEFTDYRTLMLCDLLRVNPRKIGNTPLADRSADLFYEWIWNSVAANKPWDQFVREIITARGSIYQNGPANFYRVERTPNDRMENLGQAFLGVRMACARCHKHPFDRWTTDDYWNFASFMGKVGSRDGRLVEESIIDYAPDAQVKNQSVNGKNRGKVAPCTYLGEKAPAPQSPDMVAGLAGWVTDPNNPFFARATVNRLWSYYFGRGVIYPVDDMRATTPESVPGLLDALAGELVRNKYDVKHVIRLILSSRTYQLSSLPNDSNRQDDRFFSRCFVRPMSAQVLLDMVNEATGFHESFMPFPERARTIQASLPINNAFLNAFGESHRQFLTDLNPKLEPNLVQTLLMINSPYVENKIQRGGTVDAVLKESTTDEEMVRDLYLRTLCRTPSSAEVARDISLLKSAANRKEGAQDMLWALITAREFYFNH